jgi:hypothetical protein
MASGTAYNIGTLKDRLPKYNMNIPVVIDNSGTTNGVGMCIVQTDGTLYIRPISSGSSWVRVFITATWDVA